MHFSWNLKLLINFSSLGLSSELQVNIDAEDLYLKFDKSPFKPVILNQGVAELSSSHKEVTIFLFSYIS